MPIEYIRGRQLTPNRPRRGSIVRINGIALPVADVSFDRGSFGDVRHARHTDSNIHYVVKQPNDTADDFAANITLVLKEVNFFKRVYPELHKHIKLFKYDKEETYRLVMPYLGRSLENIFESTTITAHYAIRVFYHMTKELQRLHDEFNIVHGDINLGNVLINKEGRVIFIDGSFHHMPDKRGFSEDIVSLANMLAVNVDMVMKFPVFSAQFLFLLQKSIAGVGKLDEIIACLKIDDTIYNSIIVRYKIREKYADIVLRDIDIRAAISRNNLEDNQLLKLVQASIKKHEQLKEALQKNDIPFYVYHVLTCDPAYYQKITTYLKNPKLLGMICAEITKSIKDRLLNLRQSVDDLGYLAHDLPLIQVLSHKDALGKLKKNVIELMGNYYIKPQKTARPIIKEEAATRTVAKRPRV